MDSSLPARRARGARRRLLSVGILALALALSGCALFQQAQEDAGQALAVVDQFMRAGARGDRPAALARFARAAREQRDTGDAVGRLFQDRREVFAGYQSVQQESWRINKGTRGTTAMLAGAVTSSARPAPRFTATLLKEVGQWRLVSLRLAEGVGEHGAGRGRVAPARGYWERSTA